MKVRYNKLETKHMRITFHRTLRLPEDGKTYPLPPSLGVFPVKRVDDYADRVPASWRDRGGVFVPLYQHEALWIQFEKLTHKPCAVKVGVGKVNAITGGPWRDSLNINQDYVVAPPQPWLDGIKSGDGSVKQFVAMPLGGGYTVEGQVTGEEKHGGLQLSIYPGKDEHFPVPKNVMRGIGGNYETYSSNHVNVVLGDTMGFDEEAGAAGSVEVTSTVVMAGGAPVSKGDVKFKSMYSRSDESPLRRTSVRRKGPADEPTIRSRRTRARVAQAAEMGLAAGGNMKQKIYPDPHGCEVWDQESKERVFVHLVNSQMYREITGEDPPATPITQGTYIQYAYPWYDVWDENLGDVSTPGVLAGVKTTSQIDEEKGFTHPQTDNTSITVTTVVNVGTPKVVKKNELDGAW